MNAVAGAHIFRFPEYNPSLVPSYLRIIEDLDSLISGHLTDPIVVQVAEHYAGALGPWKHPRED